MMLPTILKLGPVTVSSLGTMIVLGLFLGTFLIWKKGREENFEEETLMDGILLTILVSFLAARAGYVFFFWKQLEGSLLVFFDFVGRPGFSFFGALIGGVLSLAFFCQKQKWDFFKVADLGSFGAALAVGFIYTGVFLDGSLKAAYQAGFLLIIFRLLFYFDKHYRTYDWYQNKRGEAASGFLFLVFLILFSLSRLAVAFIGQDDLYWKWSSIDLVVILLGVGWLYYRSGRNFSLSWGSSLKKRKRNKQKFHFKSGMEAK